MSRPAGALVRAAVFLIQLYRHTISPLRLPTCRFIPTCSQYAVDALTEYGLVRGGWLATIRLLKCGPWHRGGWDPIPERPGSAHQGGHHCAADGDSPDGGVAADGDSALRAGSETRV
ncbi:membrane protein insertion efficiency factor YidD [Mycolicibacterium phlei]